MLPCKILSPSMFDIYYVQMVYLLLSKMVPLRYSDQLTMTSTQSSD